MLYSVELAIFMTAFSFIDYSGLYFTGIKKTGLPKKRGGKFVQIFDGANGHEYLVLSPGELSVYHANIVERFCAQRKIEGSYNSKKDFFDIRDGAWTVAGGGVWTMDDDKKILELAGASLGYGPFEAAGLKSRIIKTGALPGYSITINGL